MPPQELEKISVEELSDRYPVLLFDAYGVLVHSSGALSGAVELINGLNSSGKPYYIITNDASKLPTAAAARYRSYGLDLDPERIITAGSLLKDYFASHGLVGKRCVVLGPEDSRRYVELAGGILAPAGDPFDVLVVGDEVGFPFLETVEAVLSELYRRFDRDETVPLLLPNPDLVYPKGDAGFGIASGSVALIFEAAIKLRYPHRPDLRFVRLGKPHTAIFAEALRRCGARDMVMIGDQLETDIRGANAFGIDSALVTSGVAGREPRLTADTPRPTYLLPSIP